MVCVEGNWAKIDNRDTEEEISICWQKEEKMRKKMLVKEYSFIIWSSRPEEKRKMSTFFPYNFNAIRMKGKKRDSMHTKWMLISITYKLPVHFQLNKVLNAIEIQFSLSMFECLEKCIISCRRSIEYDIWNPNAKWNILFACGYYYWSVCCTTLNCLFITKFPMKNYRTPTTTGVVWPFH